MPGRKKRSFILLSLFTFFSIFFGCKKNNSEVIKLHTDTTRVLATTPLPVGIPLKYMFGVNTYEWNFLQSTSNSGDVSKIYEPKMAVIRNFSAVRHYLDWGRIESEQGKFTFNPAHEGSWNFDAIYQRISQDTMLMLADIKTCPQWLQNTYPENIKNAENVPAPYGLDRSDPASYILQAKVAFQFAARYGANTMIPPALVTVDKSIRWTGDPANLVKIGLNVVKFVECDNERDKWWKGAQAHQTAQEYAANMSAFYDGNKGNLGKNAGVKTADPTMQVVMGGLASASVQYVQDMINWCKTNRGYRSDGSIDLCFDVINYHFYSNDGNAKTGKTATTGLAPELSGAAAVADSFKNMVKKDNLRIPVWITENGFDINQTSTQRAFATVKQTPLLTQADWVIRSVLLYSRHYIDRLFFYQLFDDTPMGTGNYQTCGLINDDLTRRPAADYILQVNKLMGNYTYNSTINSDPIIDKYTLGTNTIYVAVVPDQKGRTATYTLSLGSATEANVYSLTPGASAMTKKTVKTNSGKLILNVSETPTFIQGL